MSGPQLVIAGAGSGKTRVLTYKIAHLLHHGYNPSRVLALTFTNKAAREMRERITKITSPEVASKLWMGTFHSIFARILRYNAERLNYKSDFTIYDASDSKNLIKLIVRDMELDDKVYKPSTIQAEISNAKNALITCDDYENCSELRERDKIAKRPLMYVIYKAYCARCCVAGAMDFDDLLLNTNILLRDNPDVLNKYQDFFQYVLVDEYQDTNFAQHMIILQLSQRTGNICVVGDDAQSIYSFRGASIDNILSLQNQYPTLEIFKLEQNYRSTGYIVDAANSLIEKNKQQIRKHIFTDKGLGHKITVIKAYSDYEESYIISNQIINLRASTGDSLDDFAILYRTNAQSRVLEEALRKRNLAYHIYGGLSFYQRKEIKDAVCYFRMSINPDDDEALRRIINFPARGIGDTTLKKIQHQAIENGVSLWQVINDAKKYGLNVNAGTQSKLAKFADLIKSFIADNERGDDAYEVALHIIKASGLYATTSCDNTPENISRRENLDELMNGVSTFIEMHEEEEQDSDLSLSAFLAEISLATDQDEQESDEPHVTLMTIHAAKGLEFKNVIIAGVEEELLPSAMSFESAAQLDEERRLMYVAITRAMRNCVITYACSRFRNGKTNTCSPSRFIKEMSPTCLNIIGPYSNDDTRPPLWRNSRQSTESEFDNLNLERLDRIGKNKHIGSYESNATIDRKPQPHTTDDVSYSSFATAETQLGGEATIHSVKELSIGMKIRHNRFGEGTIVTIDTSGMDAKIVVNFITNETRTLLLKYAKFEIL